MIRVAHFINSLAIGGAEESLARLVEATSRDIHHRVYSLLDASDLAHRMESAGARVEFLGVRRGLSRAVLGPKLWSLGPSLDVDLMQGWMYIGNLATCVAARLAGRTPVIWSIRSEVPSRPQALPWSLSSLALRVGVPLSRRPAEIVYNSVAGRESHERLGFARERARTIPNGVDTCQFSPNSERRSAGRAFFGFAEQDVVVGRIGRAHAAKDHVCFLQAMEQVAKRVPRLRLLIVGRSVDHPSGEIAKCVQRLGLAGRTVLVGQQADPVRFYRMLDILGSSSLREGFPNTVLEAMACEVPCVVTDVGDSAALVADSGKVVPAGNAHAFAKAILEWAAAAPDARRAAGRAARQRACSEFGLDRFGERWLALYRALNPRSRCTCREVRTSTNASTPLSKADATP